VGGGGHYGYCPHGGCGDNRVIQLNEDNRIECQRDSDCPRYVEKLPSTKDDFTPSTITINVVNVKFLTCGEVYSDRGDVSNVCVETEQEFCDHPLGQKDPECLRCKTGRPNPPCYRPGSGQQLQCCYDIASRSDEWWKNEGFPGSVKKLHPNFDLAKCLACSHVSPSNSDQKCEKWLDPSKPCSFFAFSIGGSPPFTVSSLGGLSAARLENLSTRKQSGCRTGQCRARNARTGRAK
jgi:hypothetical protein